MLENQYTARVASSADLNGAFRQFIKDGYRIRQLFQEQDGKYLVFCELTSDARGRAEQDDRIARAYQRRGAK